MTKVIEEFGASVRDALGGLSPNQAHYKTGVSHEYIRKMTHGVVPSIDIIRRFASGLGVDPGRLLVAAGYEIEQPSDAFEAVDLCLRSVDNIPDQGKQQIRVFVKKIEEKYKPHGS